MERSDLTERLGVWRFCFLLFRFCGAGGGVVGTTDTVTDCGVVGGVLVLLLVFLLMVFMLETSDFTSEPFPLLLGAFTLLVVVVCICFCMMIVFFTDFVVFVFLTVYGEQRSSAEKNIGENLVWEGNQSNSRKEQRAYLFLRDLLLLCGFLLLSNSSLQALLVFRLGGST